MITKIIKLALLFLTTLTLIACGGGSSGGDPETPAGGGTPPAPTETDLSIADAGGNEGENITFTVTSTPNIAKAISFRYQVNFTGAANASDFSGATTGEVTIAPNESNATIVIPIAKDGLSEPNETFQIQLSDLSPTDSTFTKNTAIGTILANEPIKISIADASGDEGSNIVFNVTATKNLEKSIVLNYTIDFTGQTASASDLISGQLTGTSTIATNDNNITIEIPTFDDSFKESNETFQIQLNAQLPLGTVFTKNTAIGTIKDNDPDGIIAISVANAQANEGENITFKVTSGLVTEQVSFEYTINFANQTAIASDLISGQTTGTSTIDANNNSTTISIAIENDSIPEPNETFQIQLSNLSTTDATFTKSTAIGTILANDPQISIADATASEGENIIFTVTANPPIAEQISFNYQVDFDNPQTLDSASADDLSGTTKSRATIDANNTTTTISIATANDLLREADETFSVILSDLAPTDATFGVDNIGRGTILASDNDASGRVIISLVANAQASEDSGTINFKMTSEFPAISAFTFNYAVVLDDPTTPNSASSADFDATNGTATIPVNDSSTTISIKIATDDTAEPDETFSLQLTPTSANVILANNSATGRILNDDLGEISDATAIIGVTEMTLNWTNPVSNFFAGVTIAQTTVATAPTDCSSGRQLGDVTSDTINLTSSTAYSFRICARSTDGSLSRGAELTNLIPSLIVDKDRNGLIEIANATEFNNIRHDLTGRSYQMTSGGVAGSGLITGCPNSGCSGYELTANIDLSSFTNWTPIGTFTAIFDGNNNQISNLTITGNPDNAGLFSVIKNATIRKLKLATVAIAGGSSVGALVGDATNSTLSNIELIGDESQSSSNAEITGNGANIGGLVGNFQGGGTISDASSSLTVRGDGGLVGQLISGTIKNSNSSGAVLSGADYIGGLIGLTNERTIISNSWASGNVSSTGNTSEGYGGLVGLTNARTTIINSWASGNVSSNASSHSQYGGLVGYNQGAIINSWASGEVRGTSEVGGLIGRNAGTISNNWASGEVFGSDKIGGLIGRSFSRGVIQGRNYQLDASAGGATLEGANPNSFHLASTADLASLSGASGSDATNSDWHAGIGTAGSPNNLLSRYCDTNGNDKIDDGTVASENPNSELRNDNTVWVMPGAVADPSNDLPPAPTTAEDGVTAQEYYRIPAIRCIANTESTTDTAEIYRLRKIEIDRQRRLFPDNR